MFFNKKMEVIVKMINENSISYTPDPERINVKLISYTPNPEKVIAAAAKLCYSKSTIADLYEAQTPDHINKFLNHLSEIGHQSPLEHVSFTFGIEGVSRAFLAQVTRHRVASFSVQSQRYVAFEDPGAFVIPHLIDQSKRARIFYLELCNNAVEHYKILKNMIIEDVLVPKIFKETTDDTSSLSDEAKDELFKKYYKQFEKMAQEEARYILPNGAETKMILTMNARELLHYFDERCCNRAQDEHRQVALRMLKLVRKIAPHLFQNAGPSCIRGRCKEGTMSCTKKYKTTDALLEDIRCYQLK